MGESLNYYYAVDENDIPLAPCGVTFSIGDRMIFTAPLTGEAPAAVCSVGGDPGTWLKEADLA
jgi:hypothetical protein